MKVIKRNGKEVDFDKNRIVNAITKAKDEVLREEGVTELDSADIEAIASEIEQYSQTIGHTLSVEEIQELVETKIILLRAPETAKHYIRYRYDHNRTRNLSEVDGKILSIIELDNEDVKQENSNKNPIVNSVQRDYMAGEISKHLTRNYFLPADIVKAHDEGIIHFHDADYYSQNMYNCCLCNLDDMLQNGTVISGTLIEKPHSFSTACNIATQVIAQVASNQYGGQTISVAHLAPFVNETRIRERKKVKKEFEDSGIIVTEEQFNKVVEARVHEDIVRGVQVIQYQVITLMTTNGQAPFITVYLNTKELDEYNDPQLKQDLIDVIKEVIEQRYIGVKNEAGAWITPAFPKLIYLLNDENCDETTKYWWLTQLSIKCSAKRLVPDYISEKKMLELKGDVYSCMGCRSFLTPDRFTDNGIGNIAKAKNYQEGKHKYYGRFNCGVVTINLPDAALTAVKSVDDNMSFTNPKDREDMIKKTFWKVLDDRLELCHKALQQRHIRLRGTISDVAPLLWQYGAIARLEKGEKIDHLLFNGYSTISLGYAGLAECVKAITGKSHTDPEVTPFALDIMRSLNNHCKKWKTEENIDYSVYGTPIESTTYKFAKCLKKRFGIIDGVTDKNYITNSYHVHVTEDINAFDKLALEAQFQELSPGGAISYVELPNMQNNLHAVEEIVKFMYHNIMYAELNVKSDYCQVCGYDGEIEIKEDENKKLYWRCPNCGNTDQNKMSVARRTCGRTYCRSKNM